MEQQEKGFVRNIDKHHKERDTAIEVISLSFNQLHHLHAGLTLERNGWHVAVLDFISPGKCPSTFLMSNEGLTDVSGW